VSDAGIPPVEFDLPIMGSPDAFGDSFAVAPAGGGIEHVEGLTGDPAIAFRRTLGMFATGVTVITARANDQVHGMTANAFMSVSLSPPLVLVSIDRRARMLSLLHEGSSFGVNVLEAGQAGLSDRFAGRQGDAQPEPSFVVARDTPLVGGALAHIVARIVRSYWGGDHSLFLGQVEYARYGEGRPLLFHGGRYERLPDDPRVLASLPPDLRTPLLESGVEVSYDDGDEIMRVGDTPEILGLVLEGQVVVERPGRSVTLAPGELVGEIEVLDGGPRIADIRAVGPVRLLEVARSDLLAALESSPRAAMALVQVLASRFREQT
jgi:flavin reductase (DIM6/NTAB) family NADH-FMN oxidoreductase RutF